MGCCSQIAVKYLFLINALVGVLGLCAIGFSAYLWINLGDLAAGINDYAITGPLVVGVFLTLATIIGHCGLKRRSKLLLFIYFFLILIIFAVMASAGFILLIYSGQIPDTGFEDAVSDFEGSIYNECCVEAGYTTDAIPLCSVNNNVTGCLTEEITVVQEICDFLEDLTLTDSNGDKVKVVGNTTLGGCGGGLGSSAFRDLISSFLSENFELIGGVQLGIVSILGLLMLAACGVACSHKDEFGGKPKRRPQDNSVEANKLV